MSATVIPRWHAATLIRRRRPGVTSIVSRAVKRSLFAFFFDAVDLAVRTQASASRGEVRWTIDHDVVGVAGNLRRLAMQRIPCERLNAEELLQRFLGPLPRPVECRTLWVRINDNDAFSFSRPLAGEMQRQRRLADAALLVKERDDHRASPRRRSLARVPIIGYWRSAGMMEDQKHQRRCSWDAAGAGLRLAGKTVPLPGSEVEVLAPRSAQVFKSSSAYTTRPPIFRYFGPVP